MNKQYKVKACVVSNIGKCRSNHEDNYLLDDGQYINIEEQAELSNAKNGWEKSMQKLNPEKVKSMGIFAVCDGMGGHNSGETASRIAVEQLNSMKEYIFRSKDIDGIKKRFQDYVTKANTVITMKSIRSPDLKGMGTTLTGILLCEEGVIPINMGDSRTYIFTGEMLGRVTRDHTEGQRLLDLGLIKEEQIHLIDGGKSITRYLGIDDRSMMVQADIGEVISINTRIWFIICSDGLTDMLKDQQIKETISGCYVKGDIEKAAKLLVEKALEDGDEKQGGIDNITVLLVEVESYISTFLDKVKGKLGKPIQFISR